MTDRKEIDEKERVAAFISIELAKAGDFKLAEETNETVIKKLRERPECLTDDYWFEKLTNAIALKFSIAVIKKNRETAKKKKET